MPKQLNTILGIVADIDNVDPEYTIYAKRPWISESYAAMAVEPDEGGVPLHLPGLEYFIEVEIAKQFLQDWERNVSVTPRVQDKCDRLIEYAETDA